jgi:serine/threonine protein kinase/tetratricopeptide (TPR) repeat protein/WD40 repeat protein
MQELDEACLRFEGAWLAGQTPQIETFLAGLAEPNRARLLRRLLELELAQRRSRGEPSTPEDYERRFPEHAELIREVFAACSSIATQPESGPPAGGTSAERSSGTVEGPDATPFPRVPGYEILRELGRGGMGVVYLARQTALKRLVALKMILAGSHAGPNELARFRTEAEAIARFRHPHIVQIYEVGECDGQSFFSLEYVDGGSLAHKLGGVPLPPAAAAELVATLAGAIHAAHEQGVIHRDLKPANILLQIADFKSAISNLKSAIPKVTDFGLAKHLDDESGRTHSGAIMGTPSYMAPEQAAGQTRRVGPLADVYALGAILYECLTGRPPFRAATVVETLQLVCHQEPVPPRQFQPTLPRDLDTICLKCLQKEAAQRYASAADLADDLRRFLDGEPIHARPVSTWERGVRWAKRRPAIAALLLTIVLLSTVGLGVVTVLWRQAEAARAGERQRAVAEAAATEHAERAEADRLRARLAGLHDEADAALARLRLLEHAAHQPDVRAEVFRQIDRFAAARSEAGRVVQALPGESEALARDDARRWEEQATVLRNEATRWLLAIRLQRGRTVTLPGPAADEHPPAVAALPLVALAPDLQQIAVHYPGSRLLRIADGDGRVRTTLDVPADFVRKGYQYTVEDWTAVGSRHTQMHATIFPHRFAFTRPDRLEYQVGHEVLAWSLPDGKLERTQRPYSRANPPFGAYHASSDRYVASADRRTGLVRVREWAPGSKSIVLWQAKDQKTTGVRETVEEICFGTDGRSLFVRSDTHLALIDAAGGTQTEQPLAERTEKASVGKLLPCPGGVALVEQRTVRGQVSSPQLVFWNAALPLVPVRGLHHDAPPRSIDLAADGVLAVGGGDHLVYAWRGLRPLWASGVPYLTETVNKAAPARVPIVAGPHEEAIGVGSETATYQASDGPDESVHEETQGWRRIAWPDVRPESPLVPVYRTPVPYRWWAFADTQEPRLVLERWELLPDGGSRPRLELYDPADGRPVFAFPATGKGRLVNTSPDRRFGAVLVEERDRRGLLELWSIPDHRRLGRLDWYALPPDDTGVRGIALVRFHYLSGRGKDWLVVERPLSTGTGAELEVWRLPEVRLAGKLVVPAPPNGVFLTGREDRAVVRRTRFARSGPFYGQVIDLESVARLCDLEAYDRVGELRNGFDTSSDTVCAVRAGYLMSEPFRVSRWDLATGKKTDLGKPIWSNATAPLVIASPSGKQVLALGTLHASGKAHAELWDLAAGRLLKEATYATAKPPLLRAFQHDHVTLRIDDYPGPGQRYQVHWRWSDGAELTEPSATAPHLITWWRNRLGGWLGFLWQDRSGLYLQDAATLQRTRLENTASGLELTGVAWPRPGGKILGLEGKGGGLWDMASGRQLARIPEGYVFRGFDPGQHWLLTVNPTAGEVRAWDVQSGRAGPGCVPKQSADWPFDFLHADLRLAPDGKRLAVLSQGVLRLWDLEKNRQVVVFPRPGHFSPVTGVVQHAATNRVASAGEEGLVLLWDRATGALIRTLFAHHSAITALAFAPDGGRLASAAEDGSVVLQDVRGSIAWRTPPTKVPIRRLAFAPSGSSLVAATEDGQLLSFAAGTGQRIGSWQVDRTAIDGLAFAPDGGLLALGTRGGRVYLWDLAAARAVRSWDCYSPVRVLAFVGEASLLATGGPSVQFWETETGRNVWTVEVARPPVQVLSVHKKTGELAVGDGADRALVIDLPALHARLEALGLGFGGFPWRRGPGGEGPNPPAGGASAGHGWRDWRRLAEEDPALTIWAASQATEAKPDEWTLWRLRGAAWARMGAHSTWEDAAADFSRALALRAVGKKGDRTSKTKVLSPFLPTALQQDDAQLWFQRGEAYVALHQWQRAIDDCSKALALGATDARVWYQRGRAYFGLRRYDLARVDFEETLRRDPRHRSAFYERCDALRGLGQYDRAIAELTEVLRRDPYSETAYATRSAAYRGKRAFAAALADANRALQLRADDAFALAQRGELYRVQGKFDQALADLDQALAYAPGYENAYASRGMVYLAKGDLGQAVADFSDALRLDPDYAEAYRQRAEVHRLRKAADAALADYTAALQHGLTDAATYRGRALASFDKADYRSSLADFDHAIELEPKNATLYLERGLAHYRNREVDQALADYEQSARLDPRLWAPWHNRGDIFLTRGQYERAVAMFTEALARGQDYEPTWRERGIAHAELGHWKEAAADFARAVQLVPDSAPAHYLRALALLGAKDRDRYRAACAQFLERARASQNRDTAYLAAWTSLLVPNALPDIEPALRLAERVARAQPRQYACDCTLALALYRTGRFHDAEQLLTDAQRRHDQGGEAHSWLLLALTHARLDRQAEARRWLDRAGHWLDDAAADRSAKGGSGALRWWQRLELQLLRQEVEQVLKK